MREQDQEPAGKWAGCGQVEERREPRKSERRLRAIVLLLVAVGVSAPGILEAQASGERGGFGVQRVTGLGYTGVLPEALLGAGVIHFFPESAFGVFADWKMTPESLTRSPAFLPDEDINAVMDPVVREVDEWLVFNGGILLRINSDFAIMGGLGVADRSRIYEFIDLAGEFSYLVQDPETSGWMSNVVLGLLFRGGDDVAFRFGLESGPSRLSVGLYLTR